MRKWMLDPHDLLPLSPDETLEGMNGISKLDHQDVAPDPLKGEPRELEAPCVLLYTHHPMTLRLPEPI